MSSWGPLDGHLLSVENWRMLRPEVAVPQAQTKGHRSDATRGSRVGEVQGPLKGPAEAGAMFGG